MEFKASNPRYSGPGMIDVDLDHPIFGIIPFTAIDNSGEELMQAIWDAAMRGDLGPIAGEPQ